MEITKAMNNAHGNMHTYKGNGLPVPLYENTTHQIRNSFGVLKFLKWLLITVAVFALLFIASAALPVFLEDSVFSDKQISSTQQQVPTQQATPPRRSIF